MKRNLLLISSLCLVLVSLYSFKAYKAKGIEILLKKRIPAGASKTSFEVVNKKQEWNPAETAIIISDMWYQHWCRGATLRVGELAPQINKVISAGRGKGMLVVQAPGECMCYYKDCPGRKIMLQYKTSTNDDTPVIIVPA